MIYLFTAINENNYTKAHVFYCDGCVYLHIISVVGSDRYLYDDNYADEYNTFGNYKYFEYSLPMDLETIRYNDIYSTSIPNDVYLENVEKYINKIIFGNI